MEYPTEIPLTIDDIARVAAAVAWHEKVPVHDILVLHMDAIGPEGRQALYQQLKVADYRPHFSLSSLPGYPLAYIEDTIVLMALLDKSSYELNFTQDMVDQW